MRCPAKTSALRTFNVKLAIEAFKTHGCNAHLCVNPKDLVSGSKPQNTLALRATRPASTLPLGPNPYLVNKASFVRL